jgi:FSR family fosmidomycin resistance protein-like MFS transporter
LLYETINDIQAVSKSDRLTLFSLSIGHFINDSYSNFLGPLLPLLISKLNLSMAQAGWLAAILVFSSSFTQPIYGYISDRYSNRVFAVLSPLVTAFFMSFLGLAPSYATLSALLLLGGIGIASFHPQAAAIVAAASSARKGLSMSIFVTSGTIGYSLGPLLIMFVVARFGLEKSYLVVIPGLITFGLLYFFVPPIQRTSISTEQQTAFRDGLKHTWQPLLILYLLVVIRSAVQMCFVSFLPLYFHLKGLGNLDAARITSIFLFAGAIGGFIGGALSDRFGGKFVISFSMILSTPCFLAFLMTQGIVSHLWLSLGGLILFSTIPVNVVMAQDLIPANTSIASALTMGFAWGMGGMAVPLIGKIGDLRSLTTALMVVMVLPLVGFFLSLGLPGRQPALEKAPITISAQNE